MKQRGQNIFNSPRVSVGLSALALVLLPGCTKGGKVSSSTSGSGGSGNGLLTISKIYPTDSGESWSPISLSGRFYIKGLKLTVSGVCSRGTQKIRVSEGAGAYDETAICDTNGEFKWNKIYASGAQEGDKTLTLTAYDATDAVIADANAQVQVRIDDTPPPAPTISSPTASPFVIPTSSPVFTVQGSASADTHRVQLPGTENFLTPSNGQWSYRASLVPGQSLSFDFYAYDLAGNKSPAASQILAWFPVVDAKVVGVFPGGQSSDANGSGMSIESSVNFTQGKVTHSSSGFTMETGFNFLSKVARGL